MIHHNPRVPLLGSFALLLISILGMMAEGLWAVTAFIAGSGILLALLLQSQARIEDEVREVEADVRTLKADVRGILARERADREAPR